MQDSGLGRLFAGAAKVTIVLTVLAFLGLHTLNFFAWTFPADQAIYRPLGFALTGGGFIAYIAIFKWMAKTDLQRFVAIAMIVICGLGELAAAGFGMQVEAYKSAGIAFTAEDIDMMIWAIRVLGGVHAVALVLDFIGDDITRAWNQRGVPIDNTVFDRHRQETPRSFPLDTPLPVRTPLPRPAPTFRRSPNTWDLGEPSTGYIPTPDELDEAIKQVEDTLNELPKDEAPAPRAPFQPE
jgi:hypothetical protein